MAEGCPRFDAFACRQDCAHCVEGETGQQPGAWGEPLADFVGGIIGDNHRIREYKLCIRE